jgi:hypothetical protein
MKIDKTSRAYRFLRSTYYVLWKQNPHVYRALLPLQMISVRTDDSARYRIQFPVHRVKAFCISPDFNHDNSSRKDLKNMATEIRGGDWDQNVIAVSDTRIHECLSRFLRSPRPQVSEWENLWDGSRSPETTLDQALIAETGSLKGLAELATAAALSWIHRKSMMEILVSVGRQGQLMCDENASSVLSLCIAQLSDCPEVAGAISVRHKTWERIRKRFFVLARSAFSEGHGSLYQQLWHPDLMDVPHLHKGDDRVQFIEAAAKKGRTGTALDIGANLGFFCHRLEDLGFRCYAIENSAILVDHMRLLRDIEGKTFAAICTNILGSNMNKVCSREYDLVLALAIFHHFLKQEKTFEALKCLLQKIRMERMVLQTHNPEEGQMLGAFKNLQPDEFADLILDMSCLTKRELMGITRHGRHVFLLSRS